MLEPVAYVCRGKDCAERDERCPLLEALADVGQVAEVKCQDLCEGPVAAVEVDGRLEWFERVRSGKARRALVELAAGRRTELPGRLRKRRATKRAGRPPKGRLRPWPRP